MDTEKAQRRVNLSTTLIACVSSLLVSTIGAVAWATQFQTKVQATVQAAAQAARVDSVVEKQNNAATSMSALQQDVTDVKETVTRVDDKIDRLLLRGRR